MSDVYSQIQELLNQAQAEVQGEIDTENQRHTEALAPLAKHQADLVLVGTTLAQLESQSSEPLPVTEPAPTPTPEPTPAPATDPSGATSAPESTDPSTPSSTTADDTVQLTDTSTGAVQVVAAADVAVASDPAVPDAALTEPQVKIRNSDWV